jgi:hypothetical protein
MRSLSQGKAAHPGFYKRSWKLLASRDENFCALAMLAVQDVQWARHWRKKGTEPLAQCFYSRAP